MDLQVIEISVRDGKGCVVLADQAHTQDLSRRVVLEFPLPASFEDTFSWREEHVAREAKHLLSAAIQALENR